VSETLQIVLLGQTFTVRSDASAAEVQRVAAFVNRKLAEVSGGRSADSLHTALLTLLNVAGDYLQLSDGGALESQSLEQRLSRLVRQLETEGSGLP
jgi:cell division protein ZapA (FtsZ GTPase activity inhibitor)